ncbi:uncharacterized protein ColSpa_09702 [Colletotrichum spaethianum]|uniref:Uncharacterized protein n=1 Tax=Colletotrichum spaethianum TaxID=700344 RepID=A0AA37PC26_9PEZI|nr:uncharacterized protein ColSpa_09702 [Colletotrichum spaethianum]GKT49521.1 hypothetical protein ColSpa_09702 [Colletotrichum spaethianum]
MSSDLPNTLGPSSFTSTSPNGNEKVDICYEADESGPNFKEINREENDAGFDELPSTPTPKRKSQANKRNQRTPENMMSTVTPLTKATGQSTDDPFIDEATPRNDNPIIIDLSSSRRAKSPDLEAGSSGVSSTPSTPTKAPGERRRSAFSQPKSITHGEALREVRRVIIEINYIKAEYRRVRGLFEHLMRDENATPVILEATVDATSRRLMRAVKDDERMQSGDPPRHLPYPPVMIPELLAAVEKAEITKRNWYAETNRLFWLLENIDNVKMPALKLKLEMARKKEAAAKQREGIPAATIACQRPVSSYDTPLSVGKTSVSSPAAARRARPDETPSASPATSEVNDQPTLDRGIRNAMRRAADSGPAETFMKKARR